jgi:hypothetical protein
MKLSFITSRVEPSIIQLGALLLNAEYKVDSDTIIVALPSHPWESVEVTLNGENVDLEAEYDVRINSVIRQAKKQFPLWSK